MMVATSLESDFLGRALTNTTPGTSDATDHLGRAVVDPDDPADPLTVNETDYLGRALQA